MIKSHPTDLSDTQKSRSESGECPDQRAHDSAEKARHHPRSGPSKVASQDQRLGDGQKAAMQDEHPEKRKTQTKGHHHRQRPACGGGPTHASHTPAAEGAVAVPSSSGL